MGPARGWRVGSSSLRWKRLELVNTRTVGIWKAFRAGNSDFRLYVSSI